MLARHAQVRFIAAAFVDLFGEGPFGTEPTREKSLRSITEAMTEL